MSLLATDLSKVTQAVDPEKDAVATGDVLCIDIDGVPGTTDATGLTVTLAFEKFEENYSG